MTLSSEQFHTLYDGAAQPVILVRDGAVAELNCHAQELFAVGTALRAYLPQDAALPEMLYARPAVLPVMAGGVCVSAAVGPDQSALRRRGRSGNLLHVLLPRAAPVSARSAPARTPAAAE